MILAEWKVILRLKCSLNGEKKKKKKSLNRWTVWESICQSFGVLSLFTQSFSRINSLVGGSWPLTLKGLGYAVKEKRGSETCILKEQWPFAFWGLEKHPRVIYFQMFGVWQILRCILPSTFLWISVQEYFGWNLIALLVIHLHYTDQKAVLEKIFVDWEILGTLQSGF